ncbi:conserved hypothetical protein [Histoplasma capsulatum H143]|uniref:C2H2-type domain-containing protein n=1 Tax=Ajellomyces capsulatus (strain H143) TaxID=544712 RepID=C6H579_AJECH|nr:conserved hypothetical protein [Histoplasma capsulatum H143]
MSLNLSRYDCMSGMIEGTYIPTKGPSSPNCCSSTSSEIALYISLSMFVDGSYYSTKFRPSTPQRTRYRRRERPILQRATAVPDAATLESTESQDLIQLVSCRSAKFSPSSQGRGPIYEQAVKCQELLDKLVAHENDVVGLCREYQDSFEYWAGHHRVFARKSSCLDNKLRNTPSSQEIIAVVLNRIDGTIINGTRRQTKLSQGRKQEPRDNLILEETEEFQWAVEGINRLLNLGFLIKSASARSKATSLLGFAQHSDLIPFKNLCSQSVEILYPNTPRELKDCLVASMTRRYAANFHPRFRRATVYKLGKDPCTPTSVNGDETEGSSEDQVSNKSDMQTSPYQFHQENYPKPPEKRNTNKIACEWCSSVLTQEILKPINWRQHVDADLTPYMCIADECPDSHPHFSEFNDWLKHMQGHGQHWYQELFQVMSWRCLDCTPDLKVFINSHRLLLHMQEQHKEHYTDRQIEIISRNSTGREPRLDKCRLCYYKIGETASPKHLYSRKRRKQPLQEMEIKIARANSEMSHPKPHSSIDDPSFDFDRRAESDDDGSDDADGSPNPKAAKTMALHVAGHLQVLMLLTVRLASIQSNEEILIENIDNDSANADVDCNSSCEYDFGKLSDIDLLDATRDGPLQKTHASDFDIPYSPGTPIPDDESFGDWNHIPRLHIPPEEDKFLQQVIKSGAYQSHMNVRNGSRVWSLEIDI